MPGRLPGIDRNFHRSGAATHPQSRIRGRLTLFVSFPRGLRLMIGGAFAFATMTAAVKYAGARIPLFEVVALRSVLVTALAALAVRRGGHSFKPRQPWRIAQRAGFGFATLSCYFYAVIHLPLAEVTVLYFTNPVLTALAAALFLGERLGPWETLLALTSLFGVVLVAQPAALFGGAGGLDPLAVGVALAAAALSAGSWVTIRSIRHDPPLLIVFYFSLSTVLLSVPLMLRDPVVPTAAEALAILIAGLATHVAQLWITWGLRLERAGRATSVSYVQIVFAAAWGWILFAEVPDGWTWLGALVIVASTTLLPSARSPA